MALKKVETCIIDATKLLEAADKLADLHGEVSEDIIERTKEEALNIVSSSPISSPGVLESIKTKNPLSAHDLITRAALEELVKCASVDKEKLDAALKEMEGYRKRSSQNPVEYPVDYAIRLCEATVAELAGYPDRASWHHLQFFP